MLLFKLRLQRRQGVAMLLLHGQLLMGSDRLANKEETRLRGNKGGIASIHLGRLFRAFTVGGVGVLFSRKQPTHLLFLPMFAKY